MKCENLFDLYYLFNLQLYLFSIYKKKIDSLI